MTEFLVVELVTSCRRHNDVVAILHYAVSIETVFLVQCIENILGHRCWINIVLQRNNAEECTLVDIGSSDVCLVVVNHYVVDVHSCLSVNYLVTCKLVVCHVENFKTTLQVCFAVAIGMVRYIYVVANGLDARCRHTIVFTEWSNQV